MEKSKCCNAKIRLGITINQVLHLYCAKCYKYNPEIEYNKKS